MFQKNPQVQVGSRLGLRTDDKITVNDLLYGLMLCSGNDAAVALAEYVGGSIDGFANLMNTKAAELGLSNTSFKTPHGLDKEGHYTTAYELALLSNYALHNETFSKIVGTKSTTITINSSPRNISNTNELLGNFNGVYGIKTGFTNGANRCLVSACKRDSMDIICVVLGADTKKFRTSDSIKLIEYSFANFTPIDISNIADDYFEDWCKNNQEYFSIYKPSNNSLNVELKLSDTSNQPYVFSPSNGGSTENIIPVRNSEIENLSFEINCENSLVAPVSKNTFLGSINIYTEGKLLYSKNILLANDIYKKEFSEYFLDILKKLPV